MLLRLLHLHHLLARQLDNANNSQLKKNRAWHSTMPRKKQASQSPFRWLKRGGVQPTWSTSNSSPLAVDTVDASEIRRWPVDMISHHGRTLIQPSHYTTLNPTISFKSHINSPSPSTLGSKNRTKTYSNLGDFNPTRKILVNMGIFPK